MSDIDEDTIPRCGTVYRVVIGKGPTSVSFCRGDALEAYKHLSAPAQTVPRTRQEQGAGNGEQRWE